MIVKGSMQSESDRERLLALIPDLGPKFLAWEDTEIEPWGFRFADGTIHLGVRAYQSIRAHLASTGVNPDDREFRKSDIN